jgi:hypothetical protein
MTRAWRYGSWAVPPLFCVAFYWYGLICWFRQDDFAWLQLPAQVESWSDLGRAMFRPLAQGTIRPWSERAYFLGLYSLFGLDPLPFRVVAFATQIVNLTLLRAVAARLTGSEAAGFWAALLWISNTALLVVMTWSAAYNQALCAFFLLLAFYFLLRYVETGERRYNVAQWAVFLLGFGALELNVVYPALAAGYTFLRARPYFRRTLPLFVPAIVYAAVHRLAAAPALADSPAYAMRFDLTTLETFWKYLVWARGTDLDPGGTAPEWLWRAGTGMILLALALFTVRRARRGETTALFCWLWFAALLAPVLPLTRHLTDYYLTLPAIGIAILGAWGLIAAWRAGTVYRAAAAALLAIYFSALPAMWSAARSRYLLTKRIESMVLGAVRARELHPDRTIVLTGVDDALFWNGILDHPFRVAGVSDVYIAPADEARLTQHPELGKTSEFVLPEPAMIDGLKKGSVVVYSAAGQRLRNVTAEFAFRADTRETAPLRVDVANELLDGLLGEGWYELEQTHRWMAERATLRIGGPKSAAQRLYVSGYCPPGQLAKGALPLAIRVAGERLAPVAIQPGTETFRFDFAIPEAAVGKSSIEVAIEVARTFQEEGAGRKLGLAFGVFEIR